MNAKRYFTCFTEAQAFFNAQSGDASIGSVRKSLRAELGNWIVQYTAAPVVTQLKSSIKVTMPNGDTATRSTKNTYAAVVVGYKAGKLSILSCHDNAANAQASIIRHNAGQYVNQNYRSKLDGQPLLILV